MSSLFAHALKAPLLLASNSPRRHELLGKIGLSFSKHVKEIEEIILPEEDPREAVQRLAVEKGQPVALEKPGNLVLSADTLVLHNGSILAKPRNAEEAIEMLVSLSGCWHEVLTGWAIHYLADADNPSGLKHFQALDCSRVRFHDLAIDEIRDYVSSGEPMDKAGAYGIQELGSLLVAEIQGDYFTVMGLPVSRVLRDLMQCEARWLEEPDC